MSSFSTIAPGPGDHVARLHAKATTCLNHNPKKALRLFERAAAAGHAASQHDAAICYYQGEGAKKNETKAVELLQEAAEKGNMDACADLGIAYFAGLGVEVNYEKSMELCGKAAKAGIARAEYYVAKYHLRDLSDNEAVKEGIQWLLSAAVKKCNPAIIALASIYATRGLRVTYDQELAVRLWEGMVNIIDPEDVDVNIWFSLGASYMFGDGVALDCAKGVGYLKQAAKKKHVNAMKILGRAYFEGLGVEKNQMIATLIMKDVDRYDKEMQHGSSPSGLTNAQDYFKKYFEIFEKYKSLTGITSSNFNAADPADLIGLAAKMGLSDVVGDLLQAVELCKDVMVVCGEEAKPDARETLKTILCKLGAMPDGCGRVCLCCGASENLKKCTKCHMATFCSKGCLYSFWPCHKGACKNWRE